MRRCSLLFLWPLLAAACTDADPPRIGVVVSAVPRHAAQIAASEEPTDSRGRFEPLLEDGTAGGAELAIRQANRFVADPAIVAVVGHANSASSIAASQIYNTAGIVQIAPTTTAPLYSQAGPYSFRLVPSDTVQAAYLAMVRRHHFPDAQRIAVVHVNDDYGRGLSRELSAHLDTIVFTGVYADGADSAAIAQLAARIIAREPDLLFWLGRPRTLGLLLPQLHASAHGLTVLCADACDAAQVYRNEGGVYTGIHFVRFTNPFSQDSAVRAFQERYRTLTGEVASSEALLTYDAVALVRAALRDGAGTPEGVRRWLVSLGRERPAYRGLTGLIEFDSSRTASRRHMLAEVRADSVVPASHRGM